MLSCTVRFQTSEKEFLRTQNFLQGITFICPSAFVDLFKKCMYYFHLFFNFELSKNNGTKCRKALVTRQELSAKKKVLVWSGNIMDLCHILGVMFMFFVMWNFCSIVQHWFLSGHQVILNLHLVNLPHGYQRQSVPEEASSRCADEAKIYTEFNNLNADTVLKAGVKICVYGT